jgi:hypothetical protein
MAVNFKNGLAKFLAAFRTVGAYRLVQVSVHRILFLLL